MLLGLMAELAARRDVIAFDTPGLGDSSPLAVERPAIADYAAAAIAALDGLGLGQVDLYGTHTGANIAVEIALAQPARVGRLILDGIALYTQAEREDLLANYATPPRESLDGVHLMWAWHFVRDQWLFWPWFKRDAAHRRAIDLPDPAFLTEVVVDVLKSLGSFPLAYAASFLYEKETRLPLLGVPTLIASPPSDIFFAQLRGIAALIPHGQVVVVGGESAEARGEAARCFSAFLDATTASSNPRQQ
jgi:pimeloyl-ACP methyl ester carboxylesterase